jgi:hypothetical protein
MRRTRAVMFAALLLAGAGCQTTGPLFDPPPLLPAGAVVHHDANPFYVPPVTYGQVFETCLMVLNDYQFEVGYSNRYDGRIETVPRVSPGLGLLIKPGSPDLYDRLLATLQTYRHRITVLIQPAENGGYFVEVIARKELEDMPRPIRSTAGAAIFRPYNDVDRQFEVVDPTFFEPGWIFRGRDVPLEQELICRIKKLL